MKELIQTSICSIIYGEFRGEKKQELFRCPRKLDHIDLKNYINENRIMLGFEADTESKSLKAEKGYLGYYRLYFRGRWYGRWMEYDPKIDRIACHGVDEIVEWLQNRFPRGCSWAMEEYLSNFPVWGCDNNRYLLVPTMSDHYKVLFDTTYGNDDYPVRIYVYE